MNSPTVGVDESRMAGKFDGIIFDLFGTLADGAAPETYERALDQMVAALAVPREGFLEFWRRTAEHRSIGKYETIEANIEDACRSLGATLDSDCLRLALVARLSFVRSTWNLKPYVAETLAQLKRRGCRLGLVSNCSADYAALWEETPLALLIEEPVFSCSVGLKKPDPRIYQLALEHMELPADRCLYVGDGESRELTGATEAGLHAVQIRWPGDDARDVHREPWPRVVSSLSEVLGLLE